MTTAADIKRQIAAINRRSTEVFTRTIPRKIERALTASAIVVANKANEYAPVEYGNLIGSQFRDIRANESDGYTARIGYTANYALPLHSPKPGRFWTARPPEEKDGPAWNPKAEPGFLTKASEETLVTVRRIMLEDLKL